MVHHQHLCVCVRALALVCICAYVRKVFMCLCVYVLMRLCAYVLMCSSARMCTSARDSAVVHESVRMCMSARARREALCSNTNTNTNEWLVAKPPLLIAEWMNGPAAKPPLLIAPTDHRTFMPITHRRPERRHSVKPVPITITSYSPSAIGTQPCRGWR